MLHPFRARSLSRARVAAALLVAVAADSLQFAVGPLGWFLFDQAVDVVAAVAECFLIGFHLLLLPTFALELIPGVQVLPTWTGCVTAVILLRRRMQPPPVAPTVPPPPKQDASSPVIDV